MTNSWGRTRSFRETQKEGGRGQRNTLGWGNGMSRQVPVTKGPLCEMQLAGVRKVRYSWRKGKIRKIRRDRAQSAL